MTAELTMMSIPSAIFNNG